MLNNRGGDKKMGELMKELKKLQEKADRYDMLREQYEKLKQEIDNFVKKVKVLLPATLSTGRRGRYGKYVDVLDKLYEEMKIEGTVVTVNMIKSRYGCPNQTAYRLFDKLSAMPGVIVSQDRPKKLQYVGEPAESDVVIKEKVNNEERTVM